MESKFIKSIIIIAVCYLGSAANAGIYIDGELHLGNVLNITDSSYNEIPISLTDHSVVNLYGNQADLNYDYAFISLSGNSVANIYYEDEIIDLEIAFGIQPAIRFNVNAHNNSVINFIYPESYNFYIEHWENDEQRWLIPYNGLQVNVNDYSLFASHSEIWRNYPSNQNHLLAPIAGEFSLQDNSVINFVPEPTTILLLSLGGILIRRKNTK